MKIVVRPIVDPQREIDLTHRLVSAIAEELWSLYGGNEQLNWLEAERHLVRLVGAAGAEADETTFVSLGAAAGRVRHRRFGRLYAAPANRPARRVRLGGAGGATARGPSPAARLDQCKRKREPLGSRQLVAKSAAKDSRQGAMCCLRKPQGPCW